MPLWNTIRGNHLEATVTAISSLLVFEHQQYAIFIMADNGDDKTDDFFGSQSDDVRSEQERRQREWEALRRPHYNAGLREGGGAAHDANLQNGFDNGFAAGARAVAEAGFMCV